MHFKRMYSCVIYQHNHETGDLNYPQTSFVVSPCRFPSVAPGSTNLLSVTILLSFLEGYRSATFSVGLLLV